MAKLTEQTVIELNKFYEDTDVFYVYNPCGFIERYKNGCLTHLTNFDGLSIWRRI